MPAAGFYSPYPQTTVGPPPPGSATLLQVWRPPRRLILLVSFLPPLFVSLCDASSRPSLPVLLSPPDVSVLRLIFPSLSSPPSSVQNAARHGLFPLFVSGNFFQTVDSHRHHKGNYRLRPPRLRCSCNYYAFYGGELLPIQSARSIEAKICFSRSFPLVQTARYPSCLLLAGAERHNKTKVLLYFIE